ncbi:hypothetical protein ABFS83_05G098700 [Erythranthe nasuta]
MNSPSPSPSTRRRNRRSTPPTTASRQTPRTQNPSSLEPPFRALIQNITADQNGRPPLCIISDVFMGWANAVAESFGTVNVTFTTGGAYGTAAYVSLWQHLPTAAVQQIFVNPP